MVTEKTCRENIVQLRFYGELNDFLPGVKKKTWFTHVVKGNPSIKDTIESLGMPHTEIGRILVNPVRDFTISNGVNHTAVDFSYQIRPGDKIKICPIDKNILKKEILLRPRLPRRPTFILDSHLGKLARYLRLFGFDTLYKRDYSDQDIVQTVKMGNRIVLTRDVGLLKNKIIRHGYWIREIHPKKQIKEVIKRFNLRLPIQSFRICLECNGKIVRIKKNKIIHRLPPKTKDYFNKFHMCLKCKKIYWQGSHYEKLSDFIRKIKKQTLKGRTQNK